MLLLAGDTGLPGTGTVAITAKDWSTGRAGLKLPLPDCDASIVQIPTPTIATLLPDTVHTGRVKLLKTTGRDEVAPALRENTGTPVLVSAGFAKLIV